MNYEERRSTDRELATRARSCGSEPRSPFPVPRSPFFISPFFISPFTLPLAELRADLVPAALIAWAFMAIIAAAEAWRRFGNPKPEWTRKLVHAGGGLVCLCFPFVLDSPWTVLLLAGGMAGLFVAGKRFGFLPSLHGVGRKSRGTEYYPLVICLLFWLAHDRPWFYVIPVLVLSVSDALAALVGSRYGKLRYEVDEEWKSVEGSLVFLAATFVAVAAPLALSGNYPPVNCLLAALLVSALVTGFEAISLHGSDNLFVPLGTYFALNKIMVQPLAEIVYQTVSLAAICLVLSFALLRVPALNVGGALALILAAYATWSLGSLDWALPVFAGLIVYLASWRAAPFPSNSKARVVMRVLFPAFLLLMAANVSWPNSYWYRYFFGPYLAVCTSIVTFSLWRHTLYGRHTEGGAEMNKETGGGGKTIMASTRTSWRRQAAAAAVSGGCSLFLAGVCWLAQPGASPLALAILAAACLPGALLNDVLIGRETCEESRSLWDAWRVSLLLAAAGLVAAVQSAGLSALWAPR